MSERRGDGGSPGGFYLRKVFLFSFWGGGGGGGLV